MAGSLELLRFRLQRHMLGIGIKVNMCGEFFSCNGLLTERIMMIKASIIGSRTTGIVAFLGYCVQKCVVMNQIKRYIVNIGEGYEAKF